MTLRVATALTDAALESAVAAAVAADDGSTLVRRCRDLVELRAVAVTRLIDVAVIDAGLRGLDRDVVRGLADQGVRLVAVADAAVGDVVAIGVPTVLPTDLRGLREALSGAAQHRPAPEPADLNGLLVGDRSSAATVSGRLVAVWGPAGAPGRTTVAIELAAELCRRAGDALLADVDTVGASIAQQLGLLDDTSGLAASVRAAGTGRLDAMALASAAVTVPAGPRVLVGLPSADRWPELRPAAVDAVMSCARTLVPWSVADVGWGIEGSDLEWADPSVAYRFGGARAVLAAADHVVCVGSADPVGLVRLIRGLGDVQVCAPTAELLVVVNRVAERQHGEIERLIVESAGRGVDAWLPRDDKAVAGAVARGVSIGEHDPGSGVVAGVADLADRLLAGVGSYHSPRVRAQGSHRRLLRGAHRGHRRRDARVE